MSFARDAADRIAEATVALSFASTGYHLRRGEWDEGATDVDLSGRVVVVTGANSGIGFVTAEALAARNAQVLMVCRNPERGERAAVEIRSRTPGADVDVLLCDVSELDQVRSLSTSIQERVGAVDRLILNAGVLLDDYDETSAGLERTFATNVLGGFLLTRLLQPALIQAPDARVLHVTSGGMYTQRLDLDVLQGQTESFDGVVAYAQTKRAQVILNEQWAERFAGTGVVSHAMHPGWADTPGVEKSLPRFHKVMKPLLRDAEQGADTLVWLATAAEPGERSGELWLDRAVRPTHKTRRTRESAEDRRELWELCESLTD